MIVQVTDDNDLKPSNDRGMEERDDIAQTCPGLNRQSLVTD